MEWQETRVEAEGAENTGYCSTDYHFGERVIGLSRRGIYLDLCFTKIPLGVWSMENSIYGGLRGTKVESCEINEDATWGQGSMALTPAACHLLLHTCACPPLGPSFSFAILPDQLKVHCPSPVISSNPAFTFSAFLGVMLRAYKSSRDTYMSVFRPVTKGMKHTAEAP